MWCQLVIFAVMVTAAHQMSSHEAIFKTHRKPRAPDIKIKQEKGEFKIEDLRSHIEMIANSIKSTTAQSTPSSTETQGTTVKAATNIVACSSAKLCTLIKEFIIERDYQLDCHEQYLKVIFELHEGLGQTSGYLTPKQGVLEKAQSTSETCNRIKR